MPIAPKTSRPAQTSKSNPIKVDWLCLDGPGAIGLTIAPGKRAPGLAGLWARDLTVDLRGLRELKTTTLVCLLPDDELDFLKIAALPESAEQFGLAFRRFPFDDGGIPHDEPRFDEFLDELAGDFQKRAHLVIHCRGGLGRSGLVAACLLLRLGFCESAADAIRKVREARGPRAVETVARSNSSTHTLCVEREREWHNSSAAPVLPSQARMTPEPVDALTRATLTGAALPAPWPWPRYRWSSVCQPSKRAGPAVECSRRVGAARGSASLLWD